MLTIQQRDLISAAFGSAVDEVVVEHYPGLTQEHQLTSRIAQRLEDRLNGLELGGARIHLTTQELPDRGRGSIEALLGADLFVSVTVEQQLSKGFLVQSKWREHSAFDRYILQCEKMCSVTKAAYGWEFGPSGTRVFNANSIARRGRSGFYQRSPFEFGRHISTMMKRLLICREGDPALGIPPGPDVRHRITDVLQGLSVRDVVQMVIKT